MEIQIQPQHIRTTVISIIVLILALTSFFGWRAGRDLARSVLVLKQTAATLQAFDYFFQDQDRYPSGSELTDVSAFGVYISQTPLPVVASKQCPVPTAYNTFDQRTFVFSYCLPRGLDGELAGTHKLTERDIPLWQK